MAAGLGFKTFTTGEVLTAADTNGYLMQGILVFASAAARDAAITSPQEGQFAYLKDTNVTTYYTGSAWANVDTTGMTNPMTTTGDSIYSSSGSTPARLGIGSTGQVLTVASGLPSWATPASGGMTLLTTTTLSGASTTSATFSSAYTQLIMYLQNVVTNTGTQANIRFNGDTGSNYAYRRYDTTSSATLGSGNADKLILFNTTAHTGKNAGHSILKLMRPSDTTTVYMEVTTLENNAAQFWTAAGVYDGSAAITNATFIADGGTFSSGTVYIYGVN